MGDVHDWLFQIIDIVSTFIEFWGVVLILITVLKEIRKVVFQYKFSMLDISKDEGLNHGLAHALEVLLAAEILKTLIAKTPEKLVEVGALVIIRIFIAFILHWEIKQKTQELVHEEKSFLQQKRMEERKKVSDLEEKEE